MTVHAAERGAALPGFADTAPASDQLADEAAPLDALLVDAALGPLRRFAPDAATARFAASLARRPGAVGRRLGEFATELARIGIGTSVLAPPRRDRRFTDPAWTGNPLLRRIVQAYLAAGQAAGQFIGDAELDWRDDKRIRFLAGNLEEALSPGNVPGMNPACSGGKTHCEPAPPCTRTRPSRCSTHSWRPTATKPHNQ